MSDEIKKQEADVIADKVAEYEKQLADMKAEFSKQLSDKEEVIKKLDAEKSTLQASVDEVKHVAYMKEVEAFIDKAIDDKKVLPSQKPALMALASEEGNEKTFAYVDGESQKEIKGNNFDLLKSFVDLQNPVIPTGEQSHYQQVDKTEKTDDDKMHEQVIAYQKENPGVSYKDAAVIVSRKA